jgi:hypothetical protein
MTWRRHEVIHVLVHQPGPRKKHLSFETRNNKTAGFAGILSTQKALKQEH